MFEPRLALASLSGEADAEWATQGAEYAGLAVLGGIAVDEQTRAAARQMVADRDRTEFLPADPIAFIDEQLSALTDVPIRTGFNVRSTTLGPLEAAATVCRDHDAVLEINAHCRQDEMCATGAGQSLLSNPERLCEQVETAAKTGVTVGVKLRTEVPGVDLPAVASAAEMAGAEMLHVDAMDSESVVADVVTATDAFVVANNGVRDEASVQEYAEYGADAVSVGRPSDDPAVLSRIREATAAWFEERSPASESTVARRQEGDS